MNDYPRLSIRKPVLDAGVLLLLAVVAIAAHSPFRREALNMLHADYAPIWTTAEEISRGKWSVFAFDMHYAGVVLTCVRAIVLKTASIISNDSAFLWKTEAGFSFGLIPALLAWAAYFTLRISFSRPSAFAAALLVSLGTRYLAGYLHNDVYTLNLFFGFFVLGYRVKHRFPFMELSSGKLCTIAAFSGLLFYNSRITVIPLAVLWLPPPEYWRPALAYFIPKDQISLYLSRIALAFLILFLYLEIFGTTLGIFFDRRVLLNSPPNLAIAGIFMTVVATRNGALRIFLNHRRRFFIAAFAFLAGFLPEILHWIHFGGIPPRSLEQTRNIPEMMDVIGKIPSLLAEIFAVPEDGWAVASRILWLTGIVGLIGFPRRDRRLQEAALLFALGLVAFVRFQNYAGLTPRYLLPVVPSLCFGAAWTFDHAFKKRVGAIVVSLLLVAHATALYSERVALAREAADSHRWETKQEVIQVFRKAGVRVVGSNDYWFTNELSVASEMNPVFFLMEGAGLVHSSALDYWSKDSVVGIVLNMPAPSPDRLTVRGENLKIRAIGSKGGRFFYLGTRE